MATAAYNKFNQFAADVANGVHNLGSNVLKVMLSNTAPVATNTVKANITEIAAGNGYVAGGTVLLIASSVQVGGVYTLLAGGNVVFTAVGGNIGPFRYCVLYNSSVVNGPLIAWFDYGSSLTLAAGQIFTDVPNALGVLQLQ